MATSRKIGFEVVAHKRPEGWKWDEMIWTKEHERHEAVIPTLFDPDLSLIPSDVWRSGIGQGEDLRIYTIYQQPHAGAPWRPMIRPGYYFLAEERFYLFGPNALLSIVDTEVDGNGFTLVNLLFPPKPGAPFRVAYMHREADGDVRHVDNFRHRVRFTGRTITEVDQYGDLVSRIEAVDLNASGEVVNYNISNLPVDPEPRPLEYVVIQRPEAYKKQWIPMTVGDGTDVVKTISLGEPIVDGTPIGFSNTNLFNEYVPGVAPGTLTAGQYTIDHGAGDIYLHNGLDDQIPGYVTYWTDYPASILFNDYYVRQMGFEWSGSTPPPYSLVTQSDYLGKSRMLPNQSFYLSYFPVLDPDEVKVFVYDPRNEDVEEWLRVDTLEEAGPDDKVFIISADGGFIVFGDGIRGRIPHRYAHIGATYKYVPIIEYMPNEKWLAYVPDTVDLQPLRNSVHRGFIYLAHKEPIVDRLVLVTDRPRVPERPDTYGPIEAGTDFGLLTVTAYTREGDVVPQQEITWHLDPAMGFINGTNPYYTPVRTITDGSGSSRVVYTPVRTASEMGVLVNLFEGDGSPTSNIITTVNPNDTLIVPENIESALDEIWVFMVLNDDPFLPYNPATREGGRHVILYRWDETLLDWIPVRPSAIIGKSRLIFDYPLPTPDDLPSLVQYSVLMDRVITVEAKTINQLTGLQITSNPVKFLLRIPASQRGVYTLPTPTSVEGSAIDSATYLTIARDGAMRFIYTSALTSTSTTTTTVSTTSSTTSSTVTTP